MAGYINAEWADLNGARLPGNYEGFALVPAITIYPPALCKANAKRRVSTRTSYAARWHRRPSIG